MGRLARQTEPLLPAADPVRNLGRLILPEVEGPADCSQVTRSRRAFVRCCPARFSGFARACREFFTPRVAVALLPDPRIPDVTNSTTWPFVLSPNVGRSRGWVSKSRQIREFRNARPNRVAPTRHRYGARRCTCSLLEMTGGSHSCQVGETSIA